MGHISNALLIEKAQAVINPKKVGEYLVGDVGAALVTDQGNIYVGVCIDLASGIGFCAEHSAIAAMVTGGEYRIEKIVATWKNEQDELFVLAPCGRCREMMRKIDPDNMLNTDVIVAANKTVKLHELLPLVGSFVPVTH